VVDAERTFTEIELNALVDAAVTRETAAASQRCTDLESEMAGLRTQLDVAEVAVTTETAARETAELALSTFQTEVTGREAAAARRGERETKVREAAAHLTDAYFTAEKLDRWAAMGDEEFGSYVAEVAELSKGVKVGPAGLPRETAMSGKAPKVEGSDGGGVLRRFLGVPAASTTDEE
jgi:hypothetical protein